MTPHQGLGIPASVIGMVIRTLTEILRRHQGHAFKVIERIRVEDKRLIYKHEITGPGGKRDEREITFELA